MQPNANPTAPLKVRAFRFYQLDEVFAHLERLLSEHTCGNP